MYLARKSRERMGWDGLMACACLGGKYDFVKKKFASESNVTKNIEN